MRRNEVPGRTGSATVLVWCLAGAIAAGLSVEARAGGLWMFEDAGPTVGTASAGRAAIASDASTARGNPAGMTRLSGTHALVGAQPIIYTVKFDADQPNTFGGGNGGDAGSVFPSAGLYYVRELNPDWRFGFMLGSALGLGVDYDDDWAGRYYVQEALLTTVAAFPSIAYRATDWLSIGGGIGLNYASLDQEAAINNEVTDPGVPDGRVELDADSWAPYGAIGLLVEPRGGTRFGLTYTSKIDHDFDDALDVSGLGPNLSAALGSVANAEAGLDINLPQQVMFSAYHALSKDLAIMGNVAWQDWSDFGESNVTLTGSTATDFTVDRNSDDTWHFAIGARYRLSPDWKLSAGLAYDTSPVDDSDRTPDMPLDRQIRASGGVQYDSSESMTMGLAYTFLDGGSADIQQSSSFRGNLIGDYERNTIHVIAAHAEWRW